MMNINEIFCKIDELSQVDEIEIEYFPIPSNPIVDEIKSYISLLSPGIVSTEYTTDYENGFIEALSLVHNHLEWLMMEYKQ
jgi:hypothetical protein